jgi:hypothetical protein
MADTDAGFGARRSPAWLLRRTCAVHRRSRAAKPCWSRRSITCTEPRIMVPLYWFSK